MRFYNKQHKYYCGIDLHTKTMYVCIIDQEGTILVHQNLKAEPESLSKSIAPYLPDIAIAAECIFTWYWLADFCALHQIPFILGHALYMKAIHGSKTKNDRIDSQKIALLLKSGMLPQAYTYPAEMRATRDLLRRRMHFTQFRAELIAHIQNTRHQCNMPDFYQKIAYKSNRKGIVELFDEPSVQKNVQCDFEVMKTLDQTIADIELFITQQVKEHNPNDYVILQSFPGIGKVLALVILYEIHDINRFPKVQDFASYARLIKPRKESAGKTYSGSNRKIGNRFLKWAFSEAAILLIRESDEIKKYHQSLKNKHGKAKALAILAHRTGRTVYFMLKNKQAFDMKRFI
jgi:transposase